MLPITRRAARGGAVLSALVMAAALAACVPTETDTVTPAAVANQVLIFPDITVTENVSYGTGASQVLDVCQPQDTETSLVNNGPRRAVVSVHGGSWREGDKAGPFWRSACEWLASEGFVVFALNYSHAPATPFPAAINDVKAAVSWLRQPAQVQLYDFDPQLIGAFGGSAGGNLVSLLGASGTGAWDTGSRVAAVVELSGPMDLTSAGLGGLTEEFKGFQLEYLGCAAYQNCANATAASPIFSLDSSDPPFFVGHSKDEYIPIRNAEILVAALTAAGVEVDYTAVPGVMHSIGMLNDPMRASIVRFLREHL
ncbi:MAG: alpha/beta hydrolase [Homoserinimonas sp.]|nr:alpha/beta hydrolase [Homoserinimonas sp.]